MTAYRFVLHCTPTAQARVRHAVRCGHSVAYKSAGQKSAEAVLDDLLSARTPKKPLEGPLVLEFVAGMPIPTSTPKKQREAMLRGEIAHTKKPDLDKLVRAVFDALKQHGLPKKIYIAAGIATKEALDRVTAHFPGHTEIYVAAVDKELTAQSYIVPGLGDAGDLAFGEKV